MTPDLTSHYQPQEKLPQLMLHALNQVSGTPNSVLKLSRSQKTNSYLLAVVGFELQLLVSCGH